VDGNESGFPFTVGPRDSRATTHGGGKVMQAQGLRSTSFPHLRYQIDHLVATDDKIARPRSRRLASWGCAV